MKKSIQIILGIIAFLGIVAIAKNNYIFSSASQERLDKGWRAYRQKDYNYAISYFILVNQEKFPEVLAPLGDCYFQIDNIDSAIPILEKVYINKKLVATDDDYALLVGELGVCYAKKNEITKAKFYLKQASDLGHDISRQNLIILEKKDSLQHLYKK